MAKRGRKPAVTSEAEASEMKPRHDTVQAEGSEQSGRKGDTLGNFAEELGAFLGNTERKASEWLAQRKKVAEQLTAIRDKASNLLSQLGIGGEVTSRVGRRRGRPAKVEGSAASLSASGGRKRKRAPMSAEARERIAAAQRKRWAKVRKARKGGEIRNG